ncbi:MAG: hypothetical protein R6W75_04515 [Smithellaceae bacterium]
MKKNKTKKIRALILAGAVFLVALLIVAYWFQHKTVVIGQYTVVYYKNQCNIDPDLLPENLEYLKTLPCLIRINWLERIASDMFQEYSYLPGRGVEKTRKIRKKQAP